MELIKKEYILLNLEGNSKEEILKQLSSNLYKNGVLKDENLYLADVFDRERISSTALGFDIAIPHGKSEGVKIPALSFARLKNEVSWDEEEKVKYIFLIAVPKELSGNFHIDILTKLSRKILNEDFMEFIKTTNSELEIKKMIEE